MIYTSYFSSKAYDPKDGVSIARYVNFPVADTCSELYPSENLLKWWKSLSKEEQNLDLNQEMFIDAYHKEVLDNLNVNIIAEKLNNKVLLCYEKSTDFCHRHIVAKWLRDNGYDCEEL